jgi:hypothetical protein
MRACHFFGNDAVGVIFSLTTGNLYILWRAFLLQRRRVRHFLPNARQPTLAFQKLLVMLVWV